MIRRMKLCSRCHQELPEDNFYSDKRSPSGLKSECKQCHKAQNKAWRSSPEGKKYRKEESKKYYQSEKGKEVIKRSQSTQAHKDYMAKWFQSENGKLSHKKYRQSDKGKLTFAKGMHTRKSREFNAEATLTLDEWQEIKKKYKYRCVYCGEKKKLTMDHIIPVSKGGSFTKENILPSCQSCNSKKCDKPVLLQLLSMV